MARDNTTTLGEPDSQGVFLLLQGERNPAENVKQEQR